MRSSVVQALGAFCIWSLDVPWLDNPGLIRPRHSISGPVTQGLLFSKRFRLFRLLKGVDQNKIPTKASSANLSCGALREVVACPDTFPLQANCDMRLRQGRDGFLLVNCSPQKSVIISHCAKIKIASIIFQRMPRGIVLITVSMITACVR